MRAFRFDRGLLLAVAIVALLAGCGPRGPMGNVPLTLYFSCDTDGRIEPCGCFTGQHGGLTRLKTYLSQQTAPQPVLVDVGNALEGPADFQQIKYRYVQRAFAGMGYSALNVGAREAQLSLTELRALKAAAPVPMLSANLLDARSGQLVFEPYRVIEHGGFRIALVGALDPGRGQEALGEGLALEPMTAALEKLLPSLRKKADFLVLLAFADEAALSDLAKRFYEFDLILGGKVRQPSQQLLTENRSIILYTTNESKAVGHLQAELAGPSKMVPRNFEIVFLEDKIPQDPSLLAESAAYREEIRHTKLSMDDPAHARADEVPGVKASSVYAGSAACAACHAAAFAKWQDSGHGHAFASLEARRSEADPSCLACHTVGFGTSSGYRREFVQTKLTDVGCESCHGPGSAHVAQRQSHEKALFKFRPLGASDCVACHHGEFSRPFNWDEFWPPIKHGPEVAARSP